MDMSFSAEDLAFRDEVRAFLDDKLNARLREGAANTPSALVRMVPPTQKPKALICSVPAISCTTWMALMAT